MSKVNKFVEDFKKKWAGQDIPCDKCGNYNHRIAFDKDMNITFRCLNCGKVTTMHYLIGLASGDFKREKLCPYGKVPQNKAGTMPCCLDKCPATIKSSCDWRFE